MQNRQEAPNRRDFLGLAGLGLVAASTLRGADAPVLIDNVKGNFRFRKGGNKYSSGGSVAMEGYEIVHAVFATPPPMAKGFAILEAYLKQQHRPPQALAGVELRSPKPFTFEAFGELNSVYMAALSKQDHMVNDANPVARVNVAPELDPPSEVSMYGFSYSAPQKGARPTFLAASGELSGEYPQGIVARGDTSEAGLRQKLIREFDNVDHALKEMGVDWNLVNNLAVFTVHDIHPLVRELVMTRMGAAKNFGIRWYFCRPPIQQLEVEIQVRGCSREVVL